MSIAKSLNFFGGTRSPKLYGVPSNMATTPYIVRYSTMVVWYRGTRVRTSVTAHPLVVVHLFLVVARVVTEECCNRRTRTNPRPPAQGRSLVQGRVGQQRRPRRRRRLVGSNDNEHYPLSMPSHGRLMMVRGLSLQDSRNRSNKARCRGWGKLDPYIVYSAIKLHVYELQKLI